MEIVFELDHQTISRSREDTNVVAAASQNYLTARFQALSTDWVAPITVLFNNYAVVLDADNTCLVPWEVLENSGTVTVSAFCGNLHTSTIATFPVQPSGYQQGQTPQNPSPSVYVQLVSMVQETMDLANSAVDTAQAVSQAAADGAFLGPQGPQGIPGPQGPQGPKGDQGDTGEGLQIYGHFATEEQLRVQVPTPEPGEAYSVGTAPPYDVYLWDSVNNCWRNHGQLQGPKGEPGIQGEPGQKGETGAQGVPGADGKTPVKGVDYWTAQDQAQMVEAVLQALPNGDEVAY